VSYIDVLRGDEATLAKLRNKKVIIGGTALELGDRFSTPNGGVVSGPAAAGARRRVDISGSHPAPDLGYRHAGRIMHDLADHDVLVGDASPQHEGCLVVGMAAAVETNAIVLQGKLPLILDTSLFHTAIAVSMPPLRSMKSTSGIGSAGLPRTASSASRCPLGDGLVCTDKNHLITVVESRAAAIFGYDPCGNDWTTVRSEFCATSAEAATGSLSRCEEARRPITAARRPVMEFDGRRRTARCFRSRHVFSGWQKHDGFQYGADPARHARCESAKANVSDIWRNTTR